MQNFYSSFNKYFREITEQHRNTEEELDFICSILKDKFIKVLDVACWAWRHSVPLALRWYKVLGIDFSKSQISESKKYANKMKTKAKFLVKDANTFHSIKKYDAAICMRTTLWEEPMQYAKVIQNIYKSLNLGGVLIIDNKKRNKDQLWKEIIKDYKTKKGNTIISRTMRDRFTEHFRVRESKVVINKKIYSDLCITHTLDTNQWIEELKKGGFKNFKVYPDYWKSSINKAKRIAIVAIK